MLAAVSIGFLVLLVLLGWYVSQVLLVVFGGILFAVFLDALARFLARWARLPRPVSLGGVVVALSALVVAGLWLGGPAVTGQVAALAERIPEDLARIRALLMDTRWGRLLLEAAPGPELVVPAPGDILGRISGVFSTTLGVLTNLTLIVLIGVYLAAEPGHYTGGLLHLLPRPARERGAQILEALGHALRWWLVGRAVSMAAVGVLTSLGLWLIGMPLVLALGLIAGLFSFVPYIGPIVSALPAVLIGLVQGPLMALYVVAVYAVVQFIEGNLITPITQERVVALPPAVLLTAQVMMGVLFGLMGLLLATPLTVAVIVLIQMLYVQDVLGDRVRVLGE
ncbi:MAG: AI-2E family transporter [Gammaproteobacteria bacterium]|nr:AI-2E family transporter [Gammaproteobacteria bacterium]